MKELYFVDTTLRDGEQSVGVAFTTAEKVAIAKLLDSVGVFQIEAGTPAMGKLEMEAVERILSLNLKARVSTWNRALLSDIKASLQCGATNLHISAPVSDIHIKYKLNKTRSWVIDNIKKAVYQARGYGCRVTVGAEDASRADISFLLEFARAAKDEGAEWLRVADTLGLFDPFSASERVKLIASETGLDIEIHAHNDFGLALANTLAACQAGAKYLSTTVSGLGERAGNSSFEEMVRVLYYLKGIKLPFNYGLLEELTRFVGKAANRTVWCSKTYQQLTDICIN